MTIVISGAGTAYSTRNFKLMFASSFFISIFMHTLLIYFKSKLCKEVIDDLFNPGLLLFTKYLHICNKVYSLINFGEYHGPTSFVTES